MKKNRNLMFRSKSALLFVCLAAGISLVIPACKKDNDTTANSGVSEKQAVTVVSDAMINDQSGLVTQINSAAQIASGMSAERKGAKLSDLCGLNQDGAHNGSFTSEGTTFTYDVAWNYELNCVQEVPQYLAMSYKSKLDVSSTKLTAKDSSVAVFKISGLDSTAAEWVFNQKFDHAGQITSKTDETPSFNSVIAYTSTDVKVSKTTLLIVSGTATLTISGKDSKGNSYSYSGTITFKGNKKATLVVAGGSSYELAW